MGCRGESPRGALFPSRLIVDHHGGFAAFTAGSLFGHGNLPGLLCSHDAGVGGRTGLRNLAVAVVTIHRRFSHGDLLLRQGPFLRRQGRSVSTTRRSESTLNCGRGKCREIDGRSHYPLTRTVTDAAVQSAAGAPPVVPVAPPASPDAGGGRVWGRVASGCPRGRWTGDSAPGGRSVCACPDAGGAAGAGGSGGLVTLGTAVVSAGDAGS